MADRYWVGGSATWDDTAGTKWAATSGGAGGASAPTSGDNVFFDANSGFAVVVTANNPVAVCADLTINNANLRLTGRPSIYGNLNIVDMTEDANQFFDLVGGANTTISSNPAKTIYRIFITKTTDAVVVTTLTDLLMYRIDTVTGTWDNTNPAVTTITADTLSLNTPTLFGSATYICAGFNVSSTATLTKGTATVRIENFDDSGFSVDVPGCPPVEIVSGQNSLYMYGTNYPEVTVSGSGLTLRIGADITLEAFNISANNLLIGDFGIYTITAPSTIMYSCACKDIGVADPETFTVIGGVDLGGTTNIIFTQPAMTTSASWVI